MPGVDLHAVVELQQFVERIEQHRGELLVVRPRFEIWPPHFASEQRIARKHGPLVLRTTTTAR